MNHSRLPLLIDRLRFAHGYTRLLLEQTPREHWFTMPGGVSHIAWQVGHLAMAAYRLGLERIRGRRDEDTALISDAFIKPFGRESVPDPSPQHYPAIQEILEVYERVFAQLWIDLPQVNEADLELPLERTHLICKTRGESLAWCADHHMLHAGQIGLLRRLLGLPSLW